MYILNLVTLSVKDLNAGKGFLFPTQQPRMAGLKGPFKEHPSASRRTKTKCRRCLFITNLVSFFRLNIMGDIKAFLLPVKYSLWKYHSCNLKENVTNVW
jgi:hypothetical protein